MESGIFCLPSALMCKILSQVNQRDRLAASLACRHLRAAAEDPMSNPECSVSVELGGPATAARAPSHVLSTAALRTLLTRERFRAIEKLHVRLELEHVRAAGYGSAVGRWARAQLQLGIDRYAGAGDDLELELGVALSAAAPSLRRLELTLESGVALESARLQLARSVPQLRELAVHFRRDGGREAISIQPAVFISALGGTHHRLRRADVSLQLDSPSSWPSVSAAAPALTFVSKMRLLGSAAPALEALAAAGISTGDLHVVDANLAQDQSIARAVVAISRSASSVCFVSCALPEEWPDAGAGAGAGATPAFAGTSCFSMLDCRITPRVLDALARTGLAESARTICIRAVDIVAEGLQCSGGDVVEFLQRMAHLRRAQLRISWAWPGYADLLRRLAASSIDLASVTVEGTLEGQGETEPVDVMMNSDVYDAYALFDAARQQQRTRARPALLAERCASGAAAAAAAATLAPKDPEPELESVPAFAICIPRKQALGIALSFLWVLHLQGLPYALSCLAVFVGSGYLQDIACRATRPLPRLLGGGGPGPHPWAAFGAIGALQVAFLIGRELGQLPPASARQRGALLAFCTACC
eukprot:tig00021070_g17917.t1